MTHTDQQGNELPERIIVAMTDHGDYWAEYDGPAETLTPEQCRDHLEVELPQGILDNGNAIILTTRDDEAVTPQEPML